jgi:hypothetical protein
MRSSGIKRAVLGYGRVERFLERGVLGGRRFLEGLASVGLSAAEREEIGLRIYDGDFRPDRVERGLYDWERPWFAELLPPAPARILIGGAGGGREVLPLLEQGYRVTAFEPAPRAQRHCAERVGERALVLRGSYVELTEAVLHGRDTPLSALASRRFAAFLFGWGSLTHVLSRAAREELVEAAHRLSPQGPLLASFFSRGPEPPRVSRAERAGAKLGRWLVRGTQPPERLSFVPHIGFCHAFPRDEIEALGARVGRRTRWGAERTYPHVAWLLEDAAKPRLTWPPPRGGDAA